MLGHRVGCTCATCIARECRRLAKKGVIRRYKDPKTGEMTNVLSERTKKQSKIPEDKRWKGPQW